MQAQQKTVNLIAITGGTMEIEALEAMNENMYLSLLMVIEVIMRIMTFFAIASFAVYLAAVARLCFEESERPARRQMKPAVEPPEPDEYDFIGVSQVFPPQS
jgi:hypothetical protein